MSETPSLSSAMQHLKAFRATFNEGEPVDEESELTADDLSVILATIEAFSEDVVAPDPS